MLHPVIAGIAIGLASMVPAAAAADAIAAHLGTSRLVLVFADRSDEPDLLAQRRILDEDRAGMADRDLAVVPVVGSGEEARTVAQRYGVEAGRFQVVLVGKDGSAHLRSSTPIGRDDLFARIDAMPMRRAEIRQRGR